ncbi:MAG TPA: hypothetical protein PK784_07995 [Tenuifilaceae bacterium]|nr:hypothetical protein [Tenuifilaceae bacterium]HPN20485.1 hypothetical protein [Tenuifilaceae bacterium]
MDCEKCKLEMVNLFDLEVNPTEVADILEHIQQCPNCFVEYENTKKALSTLKPIQQPNAPFLLKQNIMNQLKMEGQKMSTQETKAVKLNSRFKKVLSIAAVFAILMVAIPVLDNTTNIFNHSARAANSFFESSIKATQFIKNMVIKLKVHTDASDNFALVGTTYDMVDHTIYKTFEPSAKWRIEKSGRTLVNDGNSQYLFVPKVDGYFKDSKTSSIAEWFLILLEPERVLSKEQNNIKADGSKFKMEEKEGLMYFTITSNAKGNFINDYCKNSSIEESDNRREYIFDKNTKLLKGLKIFILEGKNETLIAEITSIEYNTTIDESLFSINLPKGTEWFDLSREINNETFKNISSKRAAELFFEGLSNSNWKLVAQTFEFISSNGPKVKEVKDKFGGLTLVKLGEPFKSGQYPGEFVPYEIKLKSGKTIKHNLAVRNDNPNKVWIVDGGF